MEEIGLGFGEEGAQLLVGWSLITRLTPSSRFSFPLPSFSSFPFLSITGSSWVAVLSLLTYLVFNFTTLSDFCLGVRALNLTVYQFFVELRNCRLL